jgi:hypothetical protein
MQKISQFRDFPFLTNEPEKVDVKNMEQSDSLIEDIKNEVLEVFDEPEEIIDTVEEQVEDVLLQNPNVSVTDLEIDLKLDFVPGADDQEEIVEEEPDQLVVDETLEETDGWDWRKKGLSKFLNWVKSRFENIPKHSGKDTTGIERVIAYLKKMDSEISKAMREDFNREIDAGKAEEARLEIAEGVKRLEDRLSKLLSKKFKKSKKAIEENYLVKEAGTPRGVGNLVNSIPYFVTSIARICINSMVSSGKDMEETFKILAKEYKLDNREKFQVVQLIQDMGYTFILDRAALNKPELKPSENIDGELSLQYYS